MTQKNDLTLDPANANAGTERGLALVEQSLRDYGAGRSIVALRSGRIIAGNKTFQKARELGIPIEEIESDGQTLYVIRRTDLDDDDPRAVALGIADNRASEAGLLWNVDVLQEAEANGLDLSPFWFADERDALFGIAPEGMDPEPRTPAPSLADRFLVPPFSVLDARQGYWQDRKRQWLDTGIQSELGRGEMLTLTSEQVTSPGLNYYRDQNKKISKASPGGSPRPAATLGDDGKTVRGNGAGGRLTWVKGDRQDLDDTSGKNLAAGRKKPDSRAIRGHEWQAEKLGKVQAHTTPLTFRGAASDQDFAGQEMQTRGGGTSIFDPVLCELMYRWFTPANATILDPFAGGSVRGITASLLGRRYVGIDLSEAQIAANRDQAYAITPDALPAWHVGDSRDVHALAGGSAPFDFVFSCPPYADLEVYSDDPRDLSTMDYAEFLVSYRQIIAASCRLLAEDRFAAFVVGDIRDKKGRYRNFVSDTIQAFLDAGLALYNEAILVTAIGSLSIRAGKQFTASRKLGKTHQNCLIFVKGDPRKATAACGTITLDDLTLGEPDGDGPDSD